MPLLTMFFLGLLSCSIGTKSEQKPPNILIAIADDHSYPHTGIYGFAETQTPGFDYVAQNGVLFHNAFVAAPQCSPSRAAMLTGKNIWELEEAGTHASNFPKKFKVFTEVLEQQGYFSGYTGKPWGPGNWKISGRKQNPAGKAYNRFLLESPPTSGIKANNYSKNFKDFYSQKKGGDPFVFWYGAHEPHRVYEYKSGIKAGKNIAAVEVPQFLPDTEEVRNDVLDYILEIEHFDNHLNQIIQFLEEKGELDNTFIVVTADNGMPFPYAKANVQEFGTHVPLAIFLPNGIKGKEVNDPVGLIDLAPTLMELIGSPNAMTTTGKSLMPVLTQVQHPTHRDYVLTGRERHTHARPDNLGYPARAIRTPSKEIVMDMEDSSYFKWAFTKRPQEQLYDIQKDPYCTQNIALLPEYKEVLGQLKQQLLNDLKEQGDPRAFDNPVFDSYPRYSTMRNFKGFNSRAKYNSDFIQ